MVGFPHCLTDPVYYGQIVVVPWTTWVWQTAQEPPKAQVLWAERFLWLETFTPYPF